MVRIEYAGIPLADMEGVTLEIREGSLLDVIEALPGRITVRPPTRFEEVCDRIREANGYARRAALVPAIRPEPEWLDQ